MKLFITFEFKGFSTWGRERHNLSMTTFLSAPNHVQLPPQGLGELRKSTFFSRAKNQLTDFFFKSPKIFRARFRCMTSFTSHGHISIWGFYCDTPTPRVRENLRPCLHLTNPYVKRKVLSRTKPKGTIYKTKSLGHYITSLSLPLSLSLSLSLSFCWSLMALGMCCSRHQGSAKSWWIYIFAGQPTLVHPYERADGRI